MGTPQPDRDAMAINQFHLFRSLPLELRQEIYLLATPPRIVHLQEELEEEYDDFSERLRTTVNPIQLDSSLQHFAFNWRSHIPLKGKQRALNSFGFTGAKPLVLPWEPSPSTPEIPLDWLGEHPQVAWDLARRSNFFSVAPIPVLLHTCTESRSALMSKGYQLAFRTRWRGPRTWFHFGRDTLYLQIRAEWFPPDLVLTGDNTWDLGQFDPLEMRQVRKLALHHGGRYLSRLDDPSGPNGPIPCLSCALRLFSGLDELQLVELTPGWVIDPDADDESEDPYADPWPEPQPQYEYDTKRLWGCTDVSEADALLRLFSHRLQDCIMHSAGDIGNHLMAFKQQHGNEASYFETALVKLGRILAEDMTRLIAEEKTDTIDPWKIPRFRAVQILAPMELKVLARERRSVSLDLHGLQKQWAFMCQSRAKPNQPPEEWDIVERVFEMRHWPEDFWIYTEGQAGFPSPREQKKWWIQHGPTPDVGEISLS